MLHNIHFCVCNSLSLCLQLAVADWCGLCFLGWIGLISFLQKWPVTGIYVLMFINIIQSFLKIAFLALLLVIAFALAFYMLFFEPDEIVSIVCIPDQSECIDLS